MIQDSKHALKTFRNNLFSGARLLALGNFTAIYNHIHEIAMEDGTPLYKCDVEKLDRQDDNAAARLFSADVLQFLTDNHPDYVGEIVYLFIFGELVNAYQNRSITHAERLKLVLRARYFLDAWETFLDNTEYKRSQYFLSREAIDIARIVIEGYISLVLIHRDHLPDPFPLLPWLHSTEACEHGFGEARKIVKDFTMLDLIYMIPKLRIKIREAVFRVQGSDPKACAAGYNHTYFDNTGLNSLSLGTYPSDQDIKLIADAAAQETDSILTLLGLVPSQLHRMQKSSTSISLPSIDSWFKSNAIDNIDGLDDTGDESDDGDSDTDSLSEAQELQRLLDREEDRTLSRSRKQEEELLNLTCVAMALMADEAMKVYVCSLRSQICVSTDNCTSQAVAATVDEDVAEEILAEEYLEICNLVDGLPMIQAPDEPAKPLGQGVVTFDDLDFGVLIQMRRSHQTRQAAMGVQTKLSQDVPDDRKKKTASLKQQVIHQFHEALRESQDDKAIGTGYEGSA